MTDTEAPESGATMNVDQLAAVFDRAEQGPSVQQSKQAEEPKGEGEVNNAQEPQGEGEQVVDATAETEAETTEDDKAEEQEPFITFDADGKEVSYSRDEAIELIKKGYGYGAQKDSVKQRQSELDHQITTLTQQQQKYAHVMEQVETWLQKEADEFANIDWDALAESDPAEFIRLDHKRRKNEASMRQAKDERAKAEAELKQRYAQQEIGKLIQIMPEFKTPEAQEKWGKYLVSQGFTAEQIPAFLDHRVVSMIEKARRWDDAQVKAKATIAEVKKAPPKLAKQGTSNSQGQGTDAYSLAVKRTRKTHGLSDLAALFEAMEQRR